MRILELIYDSDVLRALFLARAAGDRNAVRRTTKDEDTPMAKGPDALADDHVTVNRVFQQHLSRRLLSLLLMLCLLI